MNKKPKKSAPIHSVKYFEARADNPFDGVKFPGNKEAFLYLLIFDYLEKVKQAEEIRKQMSFWSIARMPIERHSRNSKRTFWTTKI